MSTKQWVGPAPANPKDKVTVGYVQSQVAALNLPQATVDSLIAAGFSSYADLSYVNAQAALNATKAYVDAGDATRIKLTQINQANGVAGLGTASAKVDRSLLGLGSTQRWPTPYASPGAYNSGSVTTGLAEATIYNWTVTDPGYIYKLLIDGIVDGLTNRDGYYPVVIVRTGSPSGPAIAVGYGCTEFYSGAVIAQYNINTGPGGNRVRSFVYNIPSWAVSLDIMLLGGGGGGASGMGNPLIWGDTGFPAGWNSVSVAIGSAALPSGVTQVTGVLGAGGPGGAGAVFSNPGGPGGATSVTYHLTTISAGGASGGAGIEGNQGPTGVNPITVNGETYQAGIYGSGGKGGAGGIFIGNAGSAGGDGMVIITAHPVGGDFNVGPISVVPIPLSSLDALAGDTTIYVNLLRSIGDNTNTGEVTALPSEPSMYATPIPA